MAKKVRMELNVTTCKLNRWERDKVGRRGIRIRKKLMTQRKSKMESDKEGRV